MMGAATIFARHARTIAEDAGVGFDNQSFFVVEATASQLPGAIVTIANCSQQAVALAAYKLAEATIEEQAQRLYERVLTTFPQGKVSKDTVVKGASDFDWPVSVLVRAETGRPTIFEPVAKRYASVVDAVAKFTDIAKSPNPPNRVVVVHDKGSFGKYLRILNQTADVIDDLEPNETFVRLARAA